MLSNGTVVNVLNIGKSNNTLYLIGKRYVIKKDLFVLENCHSSNFGINIVTESSVLEDFLCNSIRSKVSKIPCVNGFVTHPLLHTVL